MPTMKDYATGTLGAGKLNPMGIWSPPWNPGGGSLDGPEGPVRMPTGLGSPGGLGGAGGTGYTGPPIPQPPIPGTPGGPPMPAMPGQAPSGDALAGILGKARSMYDAYNNNGMVGFNPGPGSGFNPGAQRSYGGMQDRMDQSKANVQGFKDALAGMKSQAQNIQNGPLGRLMQQRPAMTKTF